MISVLLNWIYILFTCFLMGFGIREVVRAKVGYEINSLQGILGLGLVVATTYAQAFSLFYKVGLVANVIMCIACAVIAVLCHRQIWKYLKVKPVNVAAVISFIVWAYFTSRGYMHYDTELYHAQSIRWIEEYGVVWGLGNLQLRFAYNSSVFALQALYSMKFLTGVSLHTISGFFAFLLTLEVLRFRPDFTLSNLSRIGAFYYLTLICDEVVSPASDYAIMCTVFYIVITWISLLEKKEDDVTPYCLLCVAGCFAVTLKLTAGLILVLVLKPAVRLVKEKRVKEIVTYLISGIAVASPWMIRTVILSGYLIYPFPALDLFDVDWKIPYMEAANDAAEISAWGRGLNDRELIGTPISQWLPAWFSSTLASTEKVMIVAAVAGVVVTVLLLVNTVVKKRYDERIFAIVAVDLSFIFWLVSAPLTRYGYAYILLAALLPWGYAFIKIFEEGLHRWMPRLIVVLFVVTILYRGLPTISYIKDSIYEDYYISQKPYTEFEMTTTDIDGVTVYIPVNGDRLGYENFPATNYTTGVHLRGSDLSEGFWREME